MHKLFILLYLLFLSSCKIEKNENQKIEIGKYEFVLSKFQKNNDTLYVVNFWATWCAPCIEEMPDFTKANKKFKEEKFKMILISLDRSKDFESKVKIYVAENNIKADVYLLDDNTKMNTWIPLINKQWDGQIPATAFYKNGKQIGFVPNSINYKTLEQIIKNNLQK